MSKSVEQTREPEEPEEGEAAAEAAPAESGAPAQAPPRRNFLAQIGTIAMTGGLVAGYGTFGIMAGRYLYPAKPTKKAWLFVADVAGFKTGSSMVYESPTGAPVVIARQGESGTEADFIALSSTCPHLGCQVHWEAPKKRFFCPCHNGTFDPQGKGTGGPPADAGQSLPRYPLKVEEGLLYIEVPVEKLA